ncbi:hypothetical protein [Paenibacillus tyrfis]|uniref:hypothetical protein n=1 Tax=Paenibacillus tyrfis TaxID=1501230 RepID=UPI0020A1C8C6|nr:hypothetical protein [Paenibacillus tyrfis]MCP1305626.1 hypothetical protein [Paenibacillus tyrfis]
MTPSQETCLFIRHPSYGDRNVSGIVLRQHVYFHAVFETHSVRSAGRRRLFFAVSGALAGEKKGDEDPC